MKKIILFLCVLLGILPVFGCVSPQKSNATDFAMSSVAGMEVVDDAVTLTTEQYEQLVLQKEGACVFTLADKATAVFAVSDSAIAVTVTAENGAKREYTVSLTVLSNATDLTVTSVAGVAVTNNAVTLTTAQYETLKAEPQSSCVFEAAQGASVEVSEKDKVVTFAVTAQDGTKKEYTVSLTVLSNATDLTVTSIAGAAVTEDNVTLTQKQYQELLQADDVASKVVFTAADKASVTLQLQTAEKVLVVCAVSEDKTVTESKTVALSVHHPFGTQARTGYGKAENVTFDYEAGAYVLHDTAAVMDGSGKAVENAFALSVSFTVEGLKANSEVVFAAYQAQNLTVRYGLRGIDETHFRLFSDYRDRSEFLSYKVLADNIVYEAGTTVAIALAVKNGSMVMRYQDATLDRRTLPALENPTLCLDVENCSAALSDFSLETDASKVRTQFAEWMTGYTDKLVGTSLLNTSQNLSKFADDGKTVSVAGKDSNSRVMGALLQEGVQVAGFEYAVAGTVNVTNTKTTGSAASKVEFQFCDDLKNYVKMHLFRFPTNNSFKAFVTNGGKNQPEVIAINNKMPKGTEYAMDFVFVYDNGRIEAWLKDGTYLPDYMLAYSLETNWGYTQFLFAMLQYCDVTFSNFKVSYGEEFDALMASLRKTQSTVKVSSSATAYEQSGDFLLTQNGGVIGKTNEQTSGYLYGGDAAVKGESWIVSADMSLTDYLPYAQAQLVVEQDERNAVRYVFEYVTGQYQVFTERKVDADNWSGIEVVLRQATANPSTLVSAVVVHGGTVSLLINGQVWHSYENSGLLEPKAKIGQKNGKAKYSNLIVETDANKVEEFANTMNEYQYESPYESRIASLATEYQNAQTGGVLLMGSSSIDYWDTWQQDIGEQTLGYNVGIGGTLVEDWMYAYDRLVKPFAPSKVVVFLGGNNVNNGDSGLVAKEKMVELLSKIHTDFPTAKICYILTTPSPSVYANGAFKTENAALNEGMRAWCNQTAWMDMIDMEAGLTQNGQPVAEYFRSDKMHLSAAGYAVWTTYVNAFLQA